HRYHASHHYSSGNRDESGEYPAGEFGRGVGESSGTGGARAGAADRFEKAGGAAETQNDRARLHWLATHSARAATALRLFWQRLFWQQHLVSQFAHHRGMLRFLTS